MTTAEFIQAEIERAERHARRWRDAITHQLNLPAAERRVSYTDQEMAEEIRNHGAWIEFLQGLQRQQGGEAA
ncbi:MAG TPA: hypothetical protein VI756_11455 [Blastocatellia bacterium]